MGDSTISDQLAEVINSNRELAETVKELKQVVTRNSSVIEEMRQQNNELIQLIRQFVDHSSTLGLVSMRERSVQADGQAIGSATPVPLVISVSSLSQDGNTEKDDTAMQVDDADRNPLPFTHAAVPSPSAPAGSLQDDLDIL